MAMLDVVTCCLQAGLWLKSVGLVQRSAVICCCSAFITWTGWTLAMTLSHDDSTKNIVIVLLLLLLLLLLLYHHHHHHPRSFSLMIAVTRLRKLLDLTYTWVNHFRPNMDSFLQGGVDLYDGQLMCWDVNETWRFKTETRLRRWLSVWHETEIKTLPLFPRSRRSHISPRPRSWENVSWDRDVKTETTGWAKK